MDDPRSDAANTNSMLFLTFLFIWYCKIINMLALKIFLVVKAVPFIVSKGVTVFQMVLRGAKGSFV